MKKLFIILALSLVSFAASAEPNQNEFNHDILKLSGINAENIMNLSKFAGVAKGKIETLEAAVINQQKQIEELQAFANDQIKYNNELLKIIAQTQPNETKF